MSHWTGVGENSVDQSDSNSGLFGAYSLLLVTAHIYLASCSDANTMDKKEKVSKNNQGI